MIQTVNLGQYPDTTASVYSQIAGADYGIEGMRLPLRLASSVRRIFH